MFMKEATLLQVALDCITSEEALQISQQVEEYVNVLEVGTPLLKSEGRRVIELLRKYFPDKLIFADTKTMDSGDLEARIVFEAGADIMSVCGIASRETIEAAIDQAKICHKQVLVDLIGIQDKLQYVGRLRWMKPDFIGIHTGIDEQRKGKYPYQDLEAISQVISLPLLVAGGIIPEDIPYVMMFHPSIIAVGSYITHADNPQVAAKIIKGEISRSSYS